MASMVNISQINGLLINAATASLAITASYALASPGGGSAFPYTGSARITGSLNVIGTTTVTGSFRAPTMTGSLQGTATNALTASYLSTGPKTLTFGGNLIQTFAEDGWVPAGITQLFSYNIINTYNNYWLDLSIITSGVASGSRIALNLYASANGITNDSLLGTYTIQSADAGYLYKMQRTFYSYSLIDSEGAGTTNYMQVYAPSLSSNNDGLIYSYSNQAIVGNNNIVGYPYLRMTVSSSRNLSCALGPSRITYG